MGRFPLQVVCIFAHRGEEGGQEVAWWLRGHGFITVGPRVESYLARFYLDDSANLPWRVDWKPRHVKRE